MRILATTITRECAVHETSGYLYVVDVDEGVVLSRAPIVEAPLRERDPNPRGGMRGGRGIAVDGDDVYVATFSSVFRYDSSWRLAGVISHPACADIHDIAFHEGALWVTSTRNDLLFQFHPDGTPLDCVNVRTLEPIMGLLESKGGGRTVNPMSSDIDFRDLGTHDPSCFDQTHLNGIAFGSEGDMFLSLGQIDLDGEKVSTVLSFDGNDGVSTVKRVVHGADVPRHNLLPLDDESLVFNDTPAGAIVQADSATGDELLRVEVSDGYLRGLLQLEDGRLVVGAQNELVITGLEHGAPRQVIRLSTDRRESIHSIAEAPGPARSLPVQFDRL